MLLQKKYRPMNASRTNDRTRAVIKRCFDIVVSAALVLVLFWLFPIVWLLIRFTSNGSPVYVQRRVGQFGEVFSCYKFRTMIPGTPERGTHETSKDSVTKIGSLMRKTKLDELPQLFNVLVGDMSLVGPRPCLPVQKDVIHAREVREVFQAKPGITGLAQVRNVDMSIPTLLADIDAEYIGSASMFVDIKILFGTFTGRGFGDKVTID